MKAIPQGDPSQQFLVNHEDFRRGMKEIIDSKGNSESLAPFLDGAKIVEFGASSYREDMKSSFVRLALMLRRSRGLRKVKVSLFGPIGSGLTTTAAMLANASGYHYVRMITSDSVVGLARTDRMRLISQAFETAANVPLSCVVIDRIEEVLEMTFSRRPVDSMTTELIGLINRDLQFHSSAVENPKMIVIVTTSRPDLADAFGPVVYDRRYDLRDLNKKEAEDVVLAYALPTAAAQVLPESIPLKRLLSCILLVADQPEEAELLQRFEQLISPPQAAPPALHRNYLAKRKSFYL
jgi:vesicle-fusing ATPase